jgi:hypothetical protein
MRCSSRRMSSRKLFCGHSFGKEQRSETARQLRFAWAEQVSSALAFVVDLLSHLGKEEICLRWDVLASSDHHFKCTSTIHLS